MTDIIVNALTGWFSILPIMIIIYMIFDFIGSFMFGKGS